MPIDTQDTLFTRDAFGRYICNTLDEAIASTRSGENPFHVVVIGGGTFGPAFASSLFNYDKAVFSKGDPFPHYNSRILVLDAGPFLIPEHGQNLPLMDLFSPSSATRAELTGQGLGDRARNEVWGIPWHSPEQFPGLAYCLGGRSLYWGGWAPRYLDEEMPTTGNSPWPAEVKKALQLPGGYFDQAAEQIGVSDPSDFINGDLHKAMRGILFKAVNDGKFTFNGPVSEAVPLDSLPDYIPTPDIPMEMVAAKKEEENTDEEAAREKLKLELRLDAPYAVQTRTRPGFFPTNKWSSMPLLTAAARQASKDSQKTNNETVNDSRRQCMVVPRTNVRRLVTVQTSTASGQMQLLVTGIEVMRNGSVVLLPLPPNAVVVLACGAIESARIALNSFQGIPNYNEIGRNLMMHIRTNTQFVVPRNHPAFNGIVWNELKVSAMQLRGRLPNNPQNLSEGYRHKQLQITASAVPNQETINGEAQLFQKVPDLDTIQHVRNTPRTHVAIAVRGIGEMEPLNPGSFVQLDPELDGANNIQRAFVRVNNGTDQSPGVLRFSERDSQVNDAIVQATNAILQIFGLPARKENSAGGASDGVDIKLDGVGTTYHEAGTLRMGTDPAKSVINSDLRFHYVGNAYVTDMSILPTCGSANPVQIGVAFGRRLARHISLPATPVTRSVLFDGSSLNFWRTAGTSDLAYVFNSEARELAIKSSGQLALLWCMIPTPPDFELSLEFLRTADSNNSGVFVRFPDPNKPLPGETMGYDNPAYIPIKKGFEVQICETDNGSSEGDPAVDDPKFRKTGVIYNGPGQDVETSVGPRPLFQWNEMRILVQGQTYEVFLNGARKTRFVNADPGRGLASTPERPSFIGLQSHFDTGRVLFRNIHLTPL